MADKKVAGGEAPTVEKKPAPAPSRVEVTTESGSREVLFKGQPPDMDLLKEGHLLGFDIPDSNKGDLGKVLGIKREGGERLVTLQSLVSGSNRVFKESELAAVPTSILVIPPTDSTFSVEEGAWYQTPEGGLIKCVNRMWVDALTGRQISPLMPLVPRLILRYSPNLGEKAEAVEAPLNRL